LLIAAAMFAAALLLLPAAAGAHGIVGRADLPIPKWLFGWGAAVVLVVSFVGLATLWPQPQLEDAPRKRLVRIPGWVDVVCGAIGVALFALLVYAGFAGSQTDAANLVPTWIYVAFWVGLPFLSIFFGDVFRLFNPWLAVGRVVERLMPRGADGAPKPPVPYPEWLGRWPAVIGIFAFAWLELAYTHRTDPSILATLSLLYAGGQVVGMVTYGVETWRTRADAFAVYFGLFALLSPWERRDGVLHLRRPLSGATSLQPLPGTVALLCTMIGSTSFDGFSNGPLWKDTIMDAFEKPFSSLGLGVDNAVEGAFTIGLVAMIFVILGLFLLGIAGMRRVESGHSERDLSRRFIHSLVPIAFAYVAAHYFSLLAYNGQALAPLLSDPLGHGKDYLGFADTQINYTWIRAGGIWYVQVIALVVGHVAGLVLAHDRALVVYKRAREATRSQLWMLCVMVCFTSLALWLLSAQNT
jgi:hypothetical protein